MSTSIVNVTVSQVVAPAPSLLQKKGALLSQGATTLAAGETALLTAAADLDAILRAAVALASLTQVAGVATGTLKSTTVVSGTYNDETGQVTLTLTGSIGVLPGAKVTVDNATGTGAFASIEGNFVADEGSTGTTLKYTIAPDLTMTITGGDVNASLGLDVGSTFWTTVSGAAQAGYNITALATVATDKTFTYAVDSTTVSPATGTPAFTMPGTVQLTQMVDDFFSQGSQQAVYVLELGAGNPDDGVTALAAYRAANEDAFYSVLAPRSWGGEASWATYLGTVSTTTSKFYGFTTVTAAQYAAFADKKAAFTMIEAPDQPDTEFTAAAPFQVTLNYAPSATNKVTPLAFSKLLGVTQYPTSGNRAFLAALKAAGVNYVASAAEGGLSNLMLVWGKVMDLRPFNYWYSVDWVQINGDLAVANAVINGSNNPINPLYYNQAGIDRLQTALAGVLNNGITYGLVLGNVRLTSLDTASYLAALGAGDFDGVTVINAIPLTPYLAANPSDYANGIYNGLTVRYTPLRGFESITVAIEVADFVAA